MVLMFNVNCLNIRNHGFFKDGAHYFKGIFSEFMNVREKKTFKVLLKSKKKVGSNHTFFKVN